MGQLLLFCGYHTLPECGSSTVTLFFFFLSFFFPQPKFNLFHWHPKIWIKFSTFLGSCSRLVLARALQSHTRAVLISASLFRAQTTSKSVRTFKSSSLLRRSSSALIQVGSSVTFCKWYCILKVQVFLPCLILRSLLGRDRTIWNDLCYLLPCPGNMTPCVSGWLFSFLGHWTQFTFYFAFTGQGGLQQCPLFCSLFPVTVRQCCHRV